MKPSLRCGQQHDRIFSLSLRSLQFAACFVAIILISSSFKGQKITLTSDDGEHHEVTVYYGSPAVNFALILTFAACLYDLFFLLLVFTLRCASIPAPWSFGVDAIFTILFMSAGCALAASDYVRYCDALDDHVHCVLLASGAALCFMAFVAFLLSVAWGAWMKNTWLTPRRKDPAGPLRALQSSDPVLGDMIVDDMERATTTYESNSHDGDASQNINMPVLTTNAAGSAPPVVGVLGGGQLGRMMADSAHRLGLQVVVLDPLGADSPAGQTGLHAVAGSFTKEEDIATLAEQCDVLTVEIEHVNASFLQQLQDNKSANLQGVHPAPATIALIQDKYQQKQFFTEVNGISVAPFDIVTSLQSARQVGESFGYPYMLKSRRFAYDGRGNAVVKSEKDLVDAFEKLGAKLLATQEKDGKADEKLIAEEEAKLYAEKWVPFVKELAVMVVKGADGDVRAYPVVETTQRDSICDTVLAPAQIPEDVAKRASEMAQTAVAQLEGRGIYGVELFLTASGEVLLNEIAPRPHNSGHYTIEACETDQFEQHLRAITGLPLGSCALRVPAALMVNVLGDPTSSEDVSFSLLRNSLSVPGAAAHFYGKAGVRPGRKLGHVTITAPNLEELTKRATLLSPEAAKNAGLLTLERKPLIGIVMGSDSDLPTMAAAADMLEKFGVPYELTIVSAHRTPARMYEYAQNAAKRGLKAIIAGAGGAAHLPGMIAALTPLPVIGVPVKTSTLNGEDSLLSIVQMPRGVPVATVAIGNSTNAGLLAVRILGAGDDSLIDAMATFLDTQKREVDEKIETMASKGWKEYLQNMKNH
ncbi:hypothetical protein BBO99_00004390 [Phytophthora kernoviae]|uniref:phosphoribosylaminoimidazole carboxylase n=1 Tax=Phytophthora kernoviae TaxID=325452 RepID=A0A3R7G0H8_9STRA|nr:hypothetical protein BBI17_004561 [Phytophthora kernoviae]RLN80600.1 hypothetical protein BBO99_00004390 [Phytophthora kernoviae]